MRNTFVSKDPLLWKKLYTTYVRPHLEYAIPAWSPYTKADKHTLEKVQKRATRTSPSLLGLSYPERLHNLGLTTLERRRERGDMIQQYKIQAGIDEISWFATPTTREARSGHRAQLQREVRTSTAQRFNFYTNRIANNWNKLADATVTASSTNGFKNRLDIDQKGYYSSTELCVTRK